MNLDLRQLTYELNGAAIEVHRTLGPGLLESAYESAFCRELFLRGIPFARQVPLQLTYKGETIDCGFRIDVLVDRRVVVELKAVERTLPIHEAQLLTYLKLSGHQVGLILNFHVLAMKDGICRMVNNLTDDSASSAPSAVQS